VNAASEASDDRSAATPLRSRAAMTWAAAMVLIAVIYLRGQGRIWWCACGRPNPISLQVHSSHNSQHLFDPYSLSHVLHGVLFFGILWLLRGRLSLNARSVIAAAIEIGWEMLENSPVIINRYRAATISLGYTGDAILNSLGDIASFVLGFYLARKLGLWRSVALFVVAELLMLWLMRDNLTLNVLMLLWPIDAVRKWQSSGVNEKRA
jgi:hypothetical protein